ncbi:cysteine--tRNA ligase [Patescibacteria group bacterium]|nr:cysteine--tRNA ligase [Patescibacteria group bacterium]
MAIKIYNTLVREKVEFKPIEKNKVRFYQCGQTVYSMHHIGNMRAMVMSDIVIRTLDYLGYKINFVRNYTDVGHLTSDEDAGEDKIEKGAKKEGLSPQELTEKYIKLFEDDTNKLNTLSPTHKPKATENIQEIIDMVQILLDKGYAYRTDLAVYFDTSKVINYTQLSGQKIEENREGAGTGEISDSQKKNPADFALWFFKAGKHKKAIQYWSSPFHSPLVKEGEGFPGWHIECSAMSKRYLGTTLDIHMGGIEHIPIHHTNEIAQSEAANGVGFVKYWLHHEHLLTDGKKMSKSKGTTFTINEIEGKGFDPLTLRSFFLQAHYRSRQNFTWEALESAQTGLNRIYEQVASWGDDVGQINTKFKEKFIEKISDDFNTPQALAVVSELLKSDIEDKDKLATILDFDKVLGLKLNEAKNKVQTSLVISELSQEIQEIITERIKARENKDYKKSDELRDKLSEIGYEIKDSGLETEIFKK